MAKSYRVIVKVAGGWRLYQTCKSYDEASEVMGRLNVRNLNKAFKRAEAKGRANISPQQYQEALNKSAIQY